MLNKLLTLLLLTISPIAATAQQTYKLDIKKSKILWDARKTMGGHHGFVLFNSGELVYTATGIPLNGSFNINMNSMRSTDHDNQADNERVDKELRAQSFFYMDHYPTAIMTVKQITRIPNSPNFKVIGDLSIKGITKQIEFTAALNKKENVINAKADLEIDRQLWHIMKQEPQTWNIATTLKDKMLPAYIAISLNLVFTK